MLQGRAGHAELPREMYRGTAGGSWGGDHRTVVQGTTRMAGENWEGCSCSHGREVEQPKPQTAKPNKGWGRRGKVKMSHRRSSTQNSR